MKLIIHEKSDINSFHYEIEPPFGEVEMERFGRILIQSTKAIKFKLDILKLYSEITNKKLVAYYDFELNIYNK
jgi:hypothetical protein